jgi:hypothetical protein
LCFHRLPGNVRSGSVGGIWQRFVVATLRLAGVPANEWSGT